MIRAENIRRQHQACENWERRVHQLQEEIEYKPWMAGELKMMENSLPMIRNDLQKALEFDHHFGTVFATSGYKTSTSLGCSLDWALVDVEYTRQCKNKVCTSYLVIF
jgi:hypothetical protein